MKNSGKINFGLKCCIFVIFFFRSGMGGKRKLVVDAANTLENSWEFLGRLLGVYSPAKWICFWGPCFAKPSTKDTLKEKRIAKTQTTLNWPEGLRECVIDFNRRACIASSQLCNYASKVKLSCFSDLLIQNKITSVAHCGVFPSVEVYSGNSFHVMCFDAVKRRLNTSLKLRKQENQLFLPHAVVQPWRLSCPSIV